MSCPCSQAEPQFKDMQFMFNGNTKISMSPKAYLMEQLFQTATVCEVGITGIPSSVSGMSMYLLGDTFLRHFYTTFDYTQISTTPTTYNIELTLNKQYVDAGDTSSFAAAQSLMGTHSPKSSVSIEDIDDVLRYHKKFKVFMGLTGFLTAFCYIGVHLYG